jgi:uncharacterized protein YcnI
MIRIPHAAACAAALSLALSCAPALAHVTLAVDKATIGKSYKAVLQIPHGCAGEATTVLRVQIPPGYINVKPMPKPGWTLEIVSGPLEKPVTHSGGVLAEGVTEIAWTGGNLPDAYYDEFVLRGTFASSLEPGRFFLPVVQECAQAEEAWIDTSGAPGAERPAPSLELVSGSGVGGH